MEVKYSCATSLLEELKQGKVTSLHQNFKICFQQLFQFFLVFVSTQFELFLCGETFEEHLYIAV